MQTRTSVSTGPASLDDFSSARNAPAPRSSQSERSPRHPMLASAQHRKAERLHENRSARPILHLEGNVVQPPWDATARDSTPWKTVVLRPESAKTRLQHTVWQRQQQSDPYPPVRDSPSEWMHKCVITVFVALVFLARPCHLAAPKSSLTPVALRRGQRRELAGGHPWAAQGRGNPTSGSDGAPIQLKGVSSMWLNWESEPLPREAALAYMRDNWKLSVIRASMARCI